MTTYYATHDNFVTHKLPHRDHSERPERIQSVWQTLKAQNLQSYLHSITPELADETVLTRVHTQEHIDILKYIATQDKLVMYDSDTYALPTSYAIASCAANSVVQLIEKIMPEVNSHGIAAVRPPGHHATRANAMGFCLINNIAVGAQYALDSGLAKRVAIVDYDVHHGNGTQDIFYEQDDVLFISTHQSPFYPGTGQLDETGIDHGQGYTLNIPLPAGVGDEGYADIFDTIVLPRLEQYKPDLILVSAGFDAHWVDPLAMMQLSLAGYATITDKLVQAADSLCMGKIIFVMEGGYDLQAIGHGMANIAVRLSGQGKFSDPYGLSKVDETSIQSLINDVRAIHQL